VGSAFAFYGYAVGREPLVARAVGLRAFKYSAVVTGLTLVPFLIFLPQLVRLLSGGAVAGRMGVVFALAFLAGTVPYLFEKVAAEYLVAEHRSRALVIPSLACTYGIALPGAFVGALVFDSGVLTILAAAVGSAALGTIYCRRVLRVWRERSGSSRDLQ
jgi:Na+-driven multidrug efflux pump